MFSPFHFIHSLTIMFWFILEKRHTYSISCVYGGFFLKPFWFGLFYVTRVFIIVFFLLGLFLPPFSLFTSFFVELDLFPFTTMEFEKLWWGFFCVPFSFSFYSSMTNMTRYIIHQQTFGILVARSPDDHFVFGSSCCHALGFCLLMTLVFEFTILFSSSKISLTGFAHRNVYLLSYFTPRIIIPMFTVCSFLGTWTCNFGLFHFNSDPEKWCNFYTCVTLFSSLGVVIVSLFVESLLDDSLQALLFVLLGLFRWCGVWFLDFLFCLLLNDVHLVVMDSLF